MILLLIGCALVALSLIVVSISAYCIAAKPPRFPEDRHLLPRMENDYICFPDWVMRHDWSFRVAIYIGERFNAGQYCFTVDRNKSDRAQVGDHWPLIK
jgi:hypothetical protein